MASGKLEHRSPRREVDDAPDMRRMSWFRLWHDMIRDPKWRLVAIRSRQPVHAVIAVAIALMTNASMNHGRRGTLSRWADDVEGAALDLEPDQVAAIRLAMDGLVIEGDRLTGWAARQPERNDDSRDRMRRHRERKRIGRVTPGDANVTPSDAVVTRSDGADSEPTEEDLESIAPLASESGSARERRAGGPKTAATTAAGSSGEACTASEGERAESLQQPTSAAWDSPDWKIREKAKVGQFARGGRVVGSSGRAVT